ncbi:hypothetical protein VC83_04240 [Pseudogymnoascus destructans]|uniref:DUF1168 domain protein n=1 Tax=Pseudogymnoascus destructans TaxID=655981 RepID=A0A177ADC5_9PEZI|nr:uncharacterized protein VC83_04240 [Pseudogymnoascus destructans]OAF59183.1 hypothetical protein VC83_04240 [Pseudogymnoascus destructans]
MSERIPESVPTSQHPSHSTSRPKKRALSPSSATAANISHLFAKPDAALALANSARSSSSPAYSAAPPEIVANVQGSSAGAGSGEFHVYKASRRREFARLKAMDEEVLGEKMEEEYEREKREREDRDREATERRRRKREGRRKNGKGGKEGGVKEGVKVGGMKPRADVVMGDAAGVSVAPALEAAQEQGLIIHDDD